MSEGSLTPAGNLIREKKRTTASGYVYLVLLLLIALAAVGGFIWGAQQIKESENPTLLLTSMFVFAVNALCFKGLFGVQPNQGVVLQLFGHYVGTERTPGLRWANPFYAKKRVSLRTRNFETSQLKVNDHDGNPIEFAAIVVWSVIDTAEAIFQVDNYENYIKVQSEAALRNLATSYPYDAHEEGVKSLRGNTAEVASHLRDEVQERLAVAGIDVKEVRISHLAYAPEIAASMLQRQQAGAIIAARTRIVEGAVGMVEMALERLAEKGTVQLDEERKAAMVCNLLVVSSAASAPRSPC